MAFELYIEDELIDLIGDEQISTDYAIAEIGNFATRSGFRSINFDIPKTANNNRILQNAFIVNNTTTRPYRRLKARVFVDGIDQNIRFADIESVQDTYNMRVYGGNASFFDLIKNLNVTDLDLSEYDHFRTLTEVVNTRTNTSGYIYPLIDYHSDSPNVRINNSNNEFNINYSFPSMFEETLLIKAAQQVGYTLNNDLLNDSDYQQTEKILPCVTPIRNIDGNKYLLKVETDTIRNYNGIDQVIFFDTLVSGTTYFNSTDVSFWESIVTFQDEVKVKGTLQLNIFNTSLVGTQAVDVKARASRLTPVLFEDIPLQTINVTDIPTIFQIPFEFDVLDDNERCEFEFMIDIPTAQVTIALTDTYYEITECKILTPLDITPFHNYITLNSLFDKLKVSELYKAYLQKYSAIVFVNEDTKTVNIFKFDKVLENIPQAIDWSEKIDYNDENNLEFALDKYGQSNTLTYKDDNNITKPFGTDGTINIDDETLESENNFVQSVYAATEMVVRLIGLQLPQIGLFETNDESPPSTTLKGKQQLRTLYLQKSAGNVDYTDLITTTTVTTNLPFAWFIRADKAYNLGFENNLIATYYTALQSVLTRTKIVTEQIRLNALDIQQLDFLKPVFLSKHNAYFYISKISGFTYGSSESTEVELVKLR